MTFGAIVLLTLVLAASHALGTDRPIARHNVRYRSLSPDPSSFAPRRPVLLEYVGPAPPLPGRGSAAAPLASAVRWSAEGWSASECALVAALKEPVRAGNADGELETVAFRWAAPALASFAEDGAASVTVGYDVDMRSAAAFVVCPSAPPGREVAEFAVRDAAVASDPGTFTTVGIRESSECYHWAIVVAQRGGGAELPAGSVLRTVQTGPVELRVWALDAPTAPAEEIEGRLWGPSSGSRALSEELHALGERPRITIDTARSATKRAVADGAVEFNVTSGHWTVPLSFASAGTRTVSVASRGVAVLGCVVATTSATVAVLPDGATRETMSLPRLDDDVALDGVSSDPCSPGFTVAARRRGAAGGTPSSYALRAEAGSEAWRDVDVSASLAALTPSSASASVVAARASVSRALLLLSDGTVVTQSDAGSFTGPFARAAGLPSPPSSSSSSSSTTPVIDRIATPTACSALVRTDGSESPRNGRALVWASAQTAPLQEGLTLYGSLDGAVTFNARAITTDASAGAPRGTDPSSIVAAAVLFDYRHDVILARARPEGAAASDPWIVTAYLVPNDDTDYAAARSVAVAGFEFSGAAALVSSPARVADPATAVVVDVSASGSGEVLVGAEALWHSGDGGASAHRITLRARDPRALGAADGLDASSGEIIVEIRSSRAGTFAVLTSLGRVFFGRAGLGTAQEIASGVPFLSSATLGSIRFGADADPAFSTLLVSPRGSGVTHPAPVANEIGVPQPPASANPAPTCPHSDVRTTLQRQYYVDMGETARLSVTVVPRDGQSNAVSVLVSDFGRVDFERSGTETPSGQVLARTETVVLRELSSELPGYTERVRDGVGEAAVRIIPRAVNLGCSEAQLVSRVRVGCPPGRSVRFIGPRDGQEPDESCPSWEGTDTEPAPTFSVPGLVRNAAGIRAFGSGDTLEDITYNATRWGCPVRVFHETLGYRLRLGLYEGDRFIETVEADFTLQEVHGRWDWSGNTTARQAGCVRGAQSREALYRASGLPENEPVSSDGIWTPANYRTCFVDPSSDDDTPSGTYEVFNSTGLNAVRFLRSGRGGMFIFRATVVDPRYSYCELSTEFAVEVYGEPLEVRTILIILACVVIFIAILLAITYAWYRRHKLHQD